MRTRYASLIVCLFLLSAGISPAAGLNVDWFTTFGDSTRGEGVNALMELPGGGFIGAGGEITYFANKSDLMVFRVGADGQLLWKNVEGVLDYDYAVGIAPSSDGNVRVLAGIRSGGVSPWAGLYQYVYTPDGALLEKGPVGNWPVNVGANDFEPDFDGGYVAAGWAESANGTVNAWLLKLDINGMPVWDSAFAFSPNDQIFSVLPLEEGGYLVCGGTNYLVTPAGTGGNYGTSEGNAFLLRTDASGTELWRRTYGTGNNLEVCRDVRHASGGFILSGAWRQPVHKGTRSYLVRVDQEGNELWSYSATDLAVCAYGAEETADGGFIHAGWDIAYESNNRPGAYVAKVSAAGLPIWHQSLNPSTVPGLWGGYLYGVVFEPVSSGGYLLGGSVIQNYPAALLFRLGEDDGSGEPPPPPPPPPVKLLAVRMKASDAAAPLNPKSKGVTPVTVLCTDDFNPALLDLDTVTLAGAPALKKKNGVKTSFEDMDGDGDLDLVVFFATESLKVTANDDSLELLGRTLSGERVAGYAPIWLVPGW